MRRIAASLLILAACRQAPTVGPPAPLPPAAERAESAEAARELPDWPCPVAVADIEWDPALKLPWPFFTGMSIVEVLARAEADKTIVDDVIGRPCRVEVVEAAGRGTTQWDVAYDEHGRVVYEASTSNGRRSFVRKIIHGPPGIVLGELGRAGDKRVEQYICRDSRGYSTGTLRPDLLDGAPWVAQASMEFDARGRPLRRFRIMPEGPILVAELRWSEGDELLEETIHDGGEPMSFRYRWEGGRPVAWSFHGQDFRTWTYGRDGVLEVVDFGDNSVVNSRRRYMGKLLIEHVEVSRNPAGERHVVNVEIGPDGRPLVTRGNKTIRHEYDAEGREIARNIEDPAGKPLERWRFAYTDCTAAAELQRELDRD